MKNHLTLYLILLLSVTALASCNIDGESYDYYTETFELYGEYNGGIGVQGEYNYYICLTNATDGNEQQGPGTSYYYFDIFSTQGTPDRNGEISLPSGTYTLGVRGATAIGTFTPDYSYYTGSDRYGDHIELGFSNGILRINGDDRGYYEIEAELTDMAGMTHYVHYVGPVEITDRSQGIINGFQQLAQDLNIQAHAANATLYDNMDGLADGISNVILSFTDMELDNEGYAGHVQHLLRVGETGPHPQSWRSNQRYKRFDCRDYSRELRHQRQRLPWIHHRGQPLYHELRKSGIQRHVRIPHRPRLRDYRQLQRSPEPDARIRVHGRSLC